MTFLRTLLFFILCFCALNSSATQTFPIEIPVFKDCSGPDSLICSIKKWQAFKAAGLELIREKIPYSFSDSYAIEFSILPNGEPKIISKQCHFSNKALELLKEHLLSLKGKLSYHNKFITYGFDLKLGIPKSFNSYKDLEEVELFPIYMDCKRFNEKGKRACFRYLILAIAEQIAETKIETEIDLYFSKGELVGMYFQNPSLKPEFNDKIFETYQTLSKEHLKESTKRKSEDFKLTFKYQGAFKDSISRRRYRFKKLEKLAELFDNKWFGKELFKMAESYYPVEPAKSQFVLSNLEKYGFGDLSKIWNGSEFVLIDELKTRSKEKIKLDIEDKPKVPLTIPPISYGCEGLKSVEEINKCFNKYIAGFVPKEFKFPRKARKKGLSGKVFVNFTIEKNGEISSIEVIKPVGALLDLECIRVVSLIEDFTKGAIIDGEPVRSQFTLPFNLKLQ